jgi:hypothetical protein
MALSLRTFSLAFLLSLFSVASAQISQPGDIPGDILVMLTPNGRPEAIATDLRMVEGVESGMYVDHEVSAPMRIWLLRFDADAVPQDRMLRAVQQHPMVIMAQNDHPVTFRATPNDPGYAQQWHHNKIQSPLAWDVTTGGVTAAGDTIVVCVVEGANLQHTDLIGNRWLNHGEIPNNGIDDDGNGYVDDHRGWNPVNNNDNVYSGSHGTQVAGMIGAKGNNGLAVAGANWNVKIMVVTVGSLTQANVIASYTYPLVMRRRYNASNGQEGAFVVATNASWGIDAANPNNYPLWCAVYDTLGTAGILNCGATTNSPLNVDVQGDMPTACPSPFMVSVTATNSNDMRTFSGYGATTIDVGAPGDNVVTTSGSSGYGGTSGTSFASPLTAGVIGLLYSAPCPTLAQMAHSDPMAAALHVREQLFAGVDQVGNLPGQTVTGGRINAHNSMQLIMNACATCPAPLNFSVSEGPGHAAVLSWNSASGGPFTVRHRPVGTAEWTMVTGVDGNTHTIAGLDPCVDHEFQVRNECGDEDSGFTASGVLPAIEEDAPQITVNGALAICQGEVVDLVSSIGNNIEWSTGATTATITVDATGTFSVTYNGLCGTHTADPVSILVAGDEPPTVEDVVMEAAGTALLTASGDSVLWYSSPTSSAPVGWGSPWETPEVSGPTSYWVSNIVSVEPEEVYGGPEGRLMPGAYHTNATYYNVFQANGPFVIRSVKVFANGAGNRSIGLVQHPSGTVVAQGTFLIPNGESRVDLNFAVPGPGQYGLRVMNGNPQLWRDGVGSAPTYPYPLGTYGAITGTTATGGNELDLYYFFYDWEVQGPAITCETERVEVLISFVTGVDEMSAMTGVHVYPNPADDVLRVQVNAPLTGEARVLVLDAAGREVAHGTTVLGRTTISTAALADGMYLLRISDSAGERARGRFVVAHP